MHPIQLIFIDDQIQSIIFIKIKPFYVCDVSLSFDYFTYKIKNWIYIALHRRAWLKPNKMRILIAVTLPAHPRSISCRGAGRDPAANAETVRSEDPFLDAVCARGEEPVNILSHLPRSGCGRLSLPAFLSSTLSGWLYAAVCRNSSRVSSGLWASRVP